MDPGITGLWSVWVRIWIGNPDPGPERQKLPTIREKGEEISCFEVLDPDRVTN